MKNLSAYLLAVLGGNAAPTADAMTNILSKGGVEADADQMNLIVGELSGKDIEAVIAAGAEKLASVPSAGAAPAAAAPAAEAAAEEEAEEEESDSDMGFDLFG